MEGSNFIQWLHRGALARDAVGGKGASLSELLAWGFPVPLGFVVTAGAYRSFEKAAGLSAQLDRLTGGLNARDTAAVQAAATAAQALVAASGLLENLREEIGTAYQELVSLSGEACAVRSSGISEDSAGASFAGLYDSYLNVRGARDVFDSVQRCYASLWSERAVRYRALKGIGAEAMAVVIMGLVPSDSSGIAFTAHPVTGDLDQVVINASWGLGEAIVSGRVTPDSFVVQKAAFTIAEREIYEKGIAIFPHPDGGGTVELELPPERARAPSITDDQALEVARLATEVERRCGRPQDIEWGIHDGRIFLLQSRPITTL